MIWFESIRQKRRNIKKEGKMGIYTDTRRGDRKSGRNRQENRNKMDNKKEQCPRSCHQKEQLIG